MKTCTTMLLALTILPACATGFTDELAGESPADDLTADAKADTAPNGVHTYYAITRDTRMCFAPGCGGFFFARLNRATTTCPNGSTAPTCYAPVLDWSEATLSAAEQSELADRALFAARNPGVHAIVRGRFEPTNDTPQPQLGRFVATEGWLAETASASSGVFVKVFDNGRRCIKEPCPWLTERGVNLSRTAVMDEVDWSYGDYGADELAAMSAELTTPSGLLMAGTRYVYDEDAGTTTGRTCTQAYHRLGDAAQ
jgi:hypothetical protein